MREVIVRSRWVYPIRASGRARCTAAEQTFRTSARSQGSPLRPAVTLVQVGPVRGHMWTSAPLRHPEEIPLAELDPVVAQDRVGGRQVEIEVRQHLQQEVGLALHHAGLATAGERDVPVL